MSPEIDRGKRHSEEAIERGLRYLAEHNGKAKKAEAAMIADGYERIPARTLVQWKTSRADRYGELRDFVQQKQDAEAVEAMFAIRRRALKVAEKTVKHYEDNLDKLGPGEAARSLKDVAIAVGVYQDKADRIQGKPTDVIEHKYDLAALQRVRARLEQELAVDSTAEELATEAIEDGAEAS